MTRDERIAAGWKEWFIVKLNQLGRAEHMHSYGSDEADVKGKGARDEYYTRAKATKRVLYYHEGCNARVVTLWRRKKPKAPPPLRVGDEVVVRGKVVSAHDSLCLVTIECPSGRTLSPRASDCERVKP